jgi:hypothetical protein
MTPPASSGKRHLRAVADITVCCFKRSHRGDDWVRALDDGNAGKPDATVNAPSRMLTCVNKQWLVASDAAAKAARPVSLV